MAASRCGHSAAGALVDARLCVSGGVQVTPAGPAPQSVAGCPALSPASANGRPALSRTPGPGLVPASTATQMLTLYLFVSLCHMIWQLLAPPPLLQAWPPPTPPRW